MRKESSVIAGYGAPTARITRSRAAAASRANGEVLPLKPQVMKPERKRTLRENSRSVAMDENSCTVSLTAPVQNKKRAVLKDLTNVCCDNSYRDGVNAAKMKSKISQRVKAVPSKAKLCSSSKHPKLVPTAVCVENALVNDDAKSKMADGIQEVVMLESQDTIVSVKLDEGLFALQNVENITVIDGESTCGAAFSIEHSYKGLPKLLGNTKIVKDNICEDHGELATLGFTDIDSDHANPQMCSLYAPDIYTNLRAAELIQRPGLNFMETLQRDITEGMRGILIDWLVEVSEEYRLVPDTLYLTVYLIDRFLSENIVERPRLQLLGITCMLIAAKYEEICAPHVEEFCFITDNTYTKREVLKMESQVLNYLGFQLCVPTIKTFLRRFLRAAQVSYKAPTLSLGYLANYLAELTLVENSFLKFLPSVMAASAVFLARWTLDQSDHPWNSTLEHYTSYRASDLKATVLAMQEVQMNLKKSPLNAIRDKYRQQKFESVAALTSSQLPQSLFFS